MNVSSSSSAANIAQLEQQMQLLENQLTAEEKSKDDAKTKQELEVALQMQIQQLQQQIQETQEETQVGQQQGASRSETAAHEGITQANSTQPSGMSMYLDVQA